jgi:hypothetical protein
VYVGIRLWRIQVCKFACGKYNHDKEFATGEFLQSNSLLLKK